MHRVIPFRVVEPTQRDINKLHQLRSMGASGHVRRRVLDFMNDINESGKEVSGINWSGRSDDSMDDLLNSSSEVFNKNGDKMRNIWISEKENDVDQDDVLSNLIRSRKQEQRQQQQEKEGDIPTVVRSSSSAVDKKDRELDHDEPQSNEQEQSTSHHSRPMGRKAIVRDRMMSIDTNNHNHNDHPNASSTLGAPKEAVSPIRMRNR